jgi:hypothetical protein
MGTKRIRKIISADHEKQNMFLHSNRESLVILIINPTTVDRLWFAVLPDDNLPILSDRNHITIIASENEVVDSTHSLHMTMNSFLETKRDRERTLRMKTKRNKENHRNTHLVPQIPSQHTPISRSGDRQSIVVIQANIRDLLFVFFQMRNQFSSSQFPESHFSLRTASENEATIVTQDQRRDASRVSILQHP